MARANLIRHIRTTRANLVTQAAAANVRQGEIYLITDEDRIAIGLSTTTFIAYPKDSEKQAANSKLTALAALGAPSAGQFPYFSGTADNMLLGQLTSQALALLDDSTKAQQRATIGLAEYAWNMNGHTGVSATNKVTTWNAESVDPGGNFASGRFTCPTGGDGLYLTGWNLLANDTSPLETAIYKNGAALTGVKGRSPGGPAYTSSHRTAIIPLVATDYLEIYVTSGTSFTETVYSGWWGYRVN